MTFGLSAAQAQLNQQKYANPGPMAQPTNWFDQNAPTSFKTASNAAQGYTNDPNVALSQLGYDLSQMQTLQGTGTSSPVSSLNPNAGFGPPGTRLQPPGSSTPTAPTASGGGSLRDQVVAKANEIGRPDIANNPDYWVGVIQQQGPNVDWGYWTDRMKSANQGGTTGGYGDLSMFTGTGGHSGYGAVPFGSLQTSGSVTPGGFSEPSAEQAMNAPGVQFALQEAQKAVERSAASKGTLLTGGTLKALAGYETGLAGQLYNDEFNRQLQSAQLNQQTGLGNAYFGLAANQANFGNLYNLAGLGQRAVLGA